MRAASFSARVFFRLAVAVAAVSFVVVVDAAVASTGTEVGRAGDDDDDDDDDADPAVVPPMSSGRMYQALPAACGNLGRAFFQLTYTLAAGTSPNACSVSDAPNTLRGGV